MTSADRKLVIVLAAFAALGLAAGVASPAGRRGAADEAADGKPADDRPWRTAWTGRTRHYFIRTNISRERLDEYSKYLEALYDDYSRFFNIKGRTPIMGVFVFKNRDEFDEFSGAIGYRASRSTRGFYTRRGGEPLTASYDLDIGGFTTRNVLAHECTHQFVDLAVPFDVPIWLNEGLAVYFEPSKWDGKKLETGVLPAARLRSLKRRIEAGDDLPLKDVVLADRAEFTVDHYGAAWSLVHFLIHADRKRYRKSFNDYFVALQRGVDPQKAFEGTIGRQFKSWDDLQKKWKAYVLALEPEKD